MIRLPRKVMYALEAVMFLAYHGTAEPMSSKDIADRQKLPPRYLEQIMQRLVRAGILRGVRGPRGGYLLARERRRITLAEICQTLDAADDEDGKAIQLYTSLGGTILMPLWGRVETEVMETLQRITLADLCEQAEGQHIRKEVGERADFTI